MIVVIFLVKHLGRTAKRSTERKEKYHGLVRLLIITCGLTALFGLTWLFAALTVIDGSVAFQVIFALFNTTQGFFIFLLFCIFNTDARQLWKETLTKMIPSKVRSGKLKTSSQTKTLSGFKVSEKKSTLPTTLRAQNTSDTGTEGGSTLKRIVQEDVEESGHADLHTVVNEDSCEGYENPIFFERQLTPHGEHEIETFEVSL